MHVKTPRLIPALITAALFVLISVPALSSSSITQRTSALGSTVTSDLSNAIFTVYVAPFIVTGVLLVAALVGGVYLAKQGPERRRELYDAIKTKPRFDSDEENIEDGGEDDGSS